MHLYNGKFLLVVGPVLGYIKKEKGKCHCLSLGEYLIIMKVRSISCLAR